MADIKLIKALRDRTALPIKDCNEALEASNNDIEASIDWLRSKRALKVAKKLDRDAAHGLVGCTSINNVNFMIKLNCETDFMALSNDFKKMMQQLLSIASKSNAKNSTELLALSIDGYDVVSDGINKSAQDTLMANSVENRTVNNLLTSYMSICGENIILNDFVRMEQGSVFHYIHSPIEAVTNTPMGKIGVLIAFDTDAANEELSDLGKDICMHIAFNKPEAISIDQISADILERERAVKLAQAEENKLPADRRDQIIGKQMEKFAASIALNEQSFIKNSDINISTLIENTSAQIGKKISITMFKIFEIAG